MFTNANIAKINATFLVVTIGQVLKMQGKIYSGKMTRAEVDETRDQLGKIRHFLGSGEQDRELSTLALSVSRLIAGDFIKQQGLILANDLGVVMFDHVMVTGMASKGQLFDFFQLCRIHNGLD